jgi:divalent metal cation (Fe/Co/Zn/Cd) transporter
MVCVNEGGEMNRQNVQQPSQIGQIGPIIRANHSGQQNDRTALIKHGRRLEYFTIAYNSLEGLIAIVAGLIAGSIALVGFGFDSVIEVTSGVALLWRLQADFDEAKRERVEAITLRIVGVCFLALALYVGYDAIKSLLRFEAPERSLVGIILATVSLVVMPLLARAKRRVAAGIRSGAMRADAKQTEFCTYLSAILLGGLLANALFSWWWADPVAALVMTPIIAKEGIEALRGETCCDDACH